MSGSQMGPEPLRNLYCDWGADRWQRAGQGDADHDAIEDDTEEFKEVLSPRFHTSPASIENAMSPNLMNTQ